MISRYSVDDYTSAMMALLPTGPAWPRDTDSVLYSSIRSLAESYQQLDADAKSAIEWSFPATALTMLPEWEATLGLPDLCSISEMETIQQRRDAVLSKLLATGGQSKDYIVNIAKSLRYEITITEFREARAGISVCGDHLNGGDWPYAWRVNILNAPVHYAQAGIAFCGDPLFTSGTKLLECTISKLAHSHTIVIFNYQ